MNNVTLNNSLYRTFQQESGPSKCNVLRPNGTNFADWENIPETVLLNGSFGFILFIIFLILTHIAWRRHLVEDIHEQNLVNFLYGYRDPEHWYVIPRYEFLRPQDRHHKHDLEYPYLYIPPKLPLANPIDAFVYDSVISDMDFASKSSLDTTSGANAVLPQLTQHNQISGVTDSSISNGKLLNQLGPATVKSSTKESPLVDLSIKNNDLPTSRKSVKILKSTSSLGLMHNSGSKAFARSFIYPSILTAEQSQATYLSRKLNRFFAMFFKVTDADIIYARGIDAYEYLLFQRHLILIMVIVNLVCLGVILPIHWLAGTSANPDIVLTTSFQRTTIKNMNANSHFHWAHIGCSAIIVLASVSILNSYKESITTRNESQLSRRTLLIGNIPKEQRNRLQLSNTLMEYFPRISIEAIQFVYDFSALYEYESYLQTAIVAKDYCKAYKQKHTRELMVHKTDVNLGRHCDGYCRLCSFFYICCCFWPTEELQPGTEYYANEERLYRSKITEACEKLVKEPTEYAFVTFRSHRQARRVMKDLARLKQELLEKRQLTSMGFRKSRLDNGYKNKSKDDDTSTVAAMKNSKDLQTDMAKPSSSDPVELTGKFLVAGNKDKDPLDPKNNPHVRSVRSPQRILSSTKTKSPLKPLSSPLESRDLGSLDHEVPLAWSVRYAPHPDNVEFNDLRYLARVSKYTGLLLHLLMIVFFIFITTPNVLLSMIERIAVIRPDRAQELTGFQGLMINYFSILLQVIMTALLPSLITLISKQIPYEDSSSKNHSVMWKVYFFLVLMVIIMPSIGMSSAQALFVSDINAECLFPTDNGSYFINYVISSTFLSTVLELIKPIDILYYYFILWTTRSTAELESGRQFIEREFSVGLQHTSVLLILSVVMTYAISCPLIAPVGLIYIVFKHSVDHYHLYYTYFTKKVDKSMQATIVIFVKVALLLMLFQTTVAISLNTGTSYFSLISQIIFWIFLAALLFNFFFDCTNRAMPSPVRRNKFKHEFCACFYLPRVVESLLKLNAIPQEYISKKL